MNTMLPPMRHLLSVLTLGFAVAAPSLAQSLCVDGLAAGLYPCENIDLLATFGTNQVGGGDMNDIWGWTDP